MCVLREELARVAGTRATVLLTGETGTGKGHAAKLLHRLSLEAAEPFVHVDCASLSPSVIESELFGHERGAFTGAHERRVGRLERAGAGTVFLDEIAEVAPPLQAKLLRVLQDRELERVGGAVTIPLEARVVAATNRDLRREIESGRFRADLFYRLQVYELRMPPLRERLDDLLELIAAALARCGDMRPARYDRAFLERLRAHAWPGNVRELQNLIERLSISSPGRVWSGADAEEVLRGAVADSSATVSARAFPRMEEGNGLAAPGVESRSHFEACEREELAQALRCHRWNVSAAARSLGLSRGALRGRMARLGLS
jgi:DNA-binding NtrC family response regulator